MNMYPLNKLCYRVVREPELRQQLVEDPEPALRAASPPLAEDQIAALLAGDVGRLSLMGANHFLLHQLARFRLFGLDLPLYADRIRAVHRDP